MSSVLIFNMGTQEPRVNFHDRWLRLNNEDKSIVDFSEFTAQPEGLYTTCQRIYELYKQDPAILQRLWFPILQPSIEYVKSQCVKSNSGGLTRIILIATDSGAEGRATLATEDPRQNDTKYAALLAQLCLQTDETPIRILEIEDQKPHLYKYAKRHLNLSGLLNFASDECIYVCTSAGLPAVGSAILWKLLAFHSGECELFQLDEPRETDLVRHRIDHLKTEPAAEAEIFTDLLRHIIEESLKRFDYPAAAEVAARIPRSPSWNRDALLTRIRHAAALWTVDLPGADIKPENDWDKYLLRGLIQIRVAEACFQVNRVRTGLVAIGDTIEFFRGFLLAKADLEDIHLMKRQLYGAESQIRKDGAAATFPTSWPLVLQLKKGVKVLRDDITHRLVAPTAQEICDALIKSGLNFEDAPDLVPANVLLFLLGVCSHLRTRVIPQFNVDKGVVTQHLQALAVPFSEINDSILALLPQSPDHRPIETPQP